MLDLIAGGRVPVFVMILEDSVCDQRERCMLSSTAVSHRDDRVRTIRLDFVCKFTNVDTETDN